MTENVFDEKSATWDDDPAKVERAAKVADAIRDAMPLGPSVRLLEYGAGTGLVTQALRSAVGSVTLADTSAGMRGVMQAKIDGGVLTDAQVSDMDLAAGPLPEPEPHERFDLIVTVLALHHIPHLAPVLANFAALLSPGGHVAIVDFDREDGSFHGDGFAGHHGFDHDALSADLTTAGFHDVTFRPCHHVIRDSRPYPMFLALATR
ncbi:MAG: class I SAM-dependent methyltransferase [Aquihabitans sp.]